MKYPIDQKTTETFMGHLIAHDRTQRQLIEALTILLNAAIDESSGDNDWVEEAEKLLKFQKRLKLDHDNRLFNEKNGIAEKPVAVVNPETAKTNYADIMPSMGIGGMISDPHENARLNEVEKDFGGEMTEEELARHFREKPKNKLKDGVDLSEKNPFKDMTLAEIEAWEEKQNNSNDIYKVKARVQNLVSATGGSLTAVGEMMVNSFVHVAKDLYDFADTIPDRNLRIQLIERVRRHEQMPAQLIAAVAGGVKVKK